MEMTTAQEAAAMPPVPAAASVIDVENLRVAYPIGRDHTRVILENLSLSVAAGEFVVVLGETGCGKSTLLRILLGQEQPRAGKVCVAGRLVERVDARSGYVPQRYSLFPNRTVLQNLMIGCEMSQYHILGRFTPGFRRFRRQLKIEAIEQLKRFGLHPSDAGKYPHQLSGGMQQRVAIAQTLMLKPSILLMDEAFSALDPATRNSLQQLLRRLWQETHPTVVFVTHNTAEALFLGTRVLVLTRDPARDDQGAHVALDMKLPGGMTLARDGANFLELAEKIERSSRAPERALAETPAPLQGPEDL